MTVTKPLVPPVLTSAHELESRHAASADIVRVTPVFSVASLSAQCGGDISVKAENLQRTGSFKLRGALSKLGTLPPECRDVVTGSAGNHAQSLAYAAGTRGLACTVYMPTTASVAKIAAVEAFGATVLDGGESVDSCVAAARDRAVNTGAAFVHPFDDPDVVAGQAGVGLELSRQVPDLAKVVVPVGGGGLAAGVALAVKASRPEVEIVGVQADACAPLADALHGVGRRTPAATIADGIAIKRPGELTKPLIERLLDDVVTVGEEAIAEAMIFLLERGKLLVEGAGAAATAALLGRVTAPAANGKTVAILSGGNVDVGILAGVIARHETVADRRLRLFTRVSDRPGGLAGLLAAVATTGASVREVTHVREGVELQVAETGIELVLETRGPRHARSVAEHLAAAGYVVQAIDSHRAEDRQ
jgi:threonine dehydratase